MPLAQSVAMLWDMHDLDDLVRRMLAERRGDWPRIAREADVSHSWISQFVRGKIDNPGYATLRRLYIYMTVRRACAET